MKKARVIAFLVVLCMLIGGVLSACGNNAPSQSEASSASESVNESSAESSPAEESSAESSSVSEPEPTPEPTPEATPEPTPEPEPTQEVSEADYSAAYLNQIRLMKDQIHVYDWQIDPWLYIEGDDPRGYLQTPSPIALADINDDTIPELLVMHASEEPEEASHHALLSIFEYKDNEAVLVYHDTLEEQEGNRWHYCLFQGGGDPALYCYDGTGVEIWNQAYSVFEREGDSYVKKEVLRKTVDYTNYPMEEEKTECYNDGTAVDVEAFDEALASLFDTVTNVISYNRIDDEALIDKAEQSGPSAFSYDEAEKLLMDQAGLSDEGEIVDFADVFPSEGVEFFFASGAGGWSTTMTVFPDGTFTGDFHDSDMGDERAENGVVYTSVFSGQLDSLKRIDFSTYEMRVAEITTEQEAETSWEEDGILFIAAEPYGISAGADCVVYRPGHTTKDLPEGFLSWVMAPRAWSEEDIPPYLPFYGFYNKTDDCGFSSGDVSETS